MANISVNDENSVFQLKKWLGLNEAPGGDTGLKMGEAAVMHNFRITREGHLQIRPGYAPVCVLPQQSPVRCMWTGYVNKKFHLLCACGGKLWDVDVESGEYTEAGTLPDTHTSMFGFGGKVYILTGSGYHCWDGVNPVASVEGYIPLVATACPPEGGGTALERVNLLTGKKRVRFSPDGQATVFHLPEREISAVVGVEGTDIEWTANTEEGTVTFAAAPAEGVDTITVTWSKGYGTRSAVESMRFAEIYNGATDARVFLYGDGTNKTVYSDLDENGIPTAEYFPAMNEMAVDNENTPITAMVRHYDRLMIYKTDSAYSAQIDTVTLEDGKATAALYCLPVNKSVGHTAMGQVRLVKNNPRTLFGQGVYEWALSGAGTRDERNAKRISQRVEATMNRLSGPLCTTFEDEDAQEFYVVYADEALVHNYANDTWYYYNHFPAESMASVDGEVYFGTPQGKIMHLSRLYRSDDGADIDAYWESGAMDFGADWRRKYSANIWVAMKPEAHSRITVTAQSDRKSNYAEKVAAYGFAVLSDVDFSHWSFNTGRRPKVVRLKIKVKKFTYYKLIFQSVSDTATATILGADMQVRYTGNVK